MFVPTQAVFLIASKANLSSQKCFILRINDLIYLSKQTSPIYIWELSPLFILTKIIAIIQTIACNKPADGHRITSDIASRSHTEIVHHASRFDPRTQRTDMAPLLARSKTHVSDRIFRPSARMISPTNRITTTQNHTLRRYLSIGNFRCTLESANSLQKISHRPNKCF